MIHIFNIVKPLQIKDEKLTITFCVHGFDDGITHCGWEPFLLYAFRDNKLEDIDNFYEKFKKYNIDDYKYIARDTNSYIIDKIVNFRN